MHRHAVLAILSAFILISSAPVAQALEKQPPATYHSRRVALAAKLHGGAAILFAGEEPILDFMPYRQDEDFYYLTGWNEPGAALLILADNGEATPHRGYREVLFLPTRNLRLEKYTGIKLDAATPNAPQTAGVDEVMPMVELPTELNKLIAADRRLIGNLWTQPSAPQAKALLGFTAATLGNPAEPAPHDVTTPSMELRLVKDPGELALLKKAADASIAAQLTMITNTKPGVTERALAGKIIAKLMEEGCERPSYAPIVGTGINSTTLHYSENSATLKDGDIMVVDAAGEYSMYASDITRTVPVNGHFTPRQREIYDVVLGAQRAAAAAFVSGKSTINDATITTPTLSTLLPGTTSTPTAKASTANRSATTGSTASATWSASTSMTRPVIRQSSSPAWSSPSNPASTFRKKKSACVSKMSSSSDRTASSSI